MDMTLDIQVGTQAQITSGLMAIIKLYLWNTEKTAVLFEINDSIIRRKRDGGLFVAMPADKFEINGEVRYKKIVKVAPQEDINCQDGYRVKFETFVMDHYNKMLQNGPQPQNPVPQAPQPSYGGQGTVGQQVPAQAPVQAPSPAPQPQSNTSTPSW